MLLLTWPLKCAADRDTVCVRMLMWPASVRAGVPSTLCPAAAGCSLSATGALPCCACLSRFKSTFLDFCFSAVTVRCGRTACTVSLHSAGLRTPDRIGNLKCSGLVSLLATAVACYCRVDGSSILPLTICTDEEADLNGLPVRAVPGQLLTEELMLCCRPAPMPAHILQR